MAEAAKSISPPNTAYQFDVSCRALSGDRSLQAHLLKVTSPSALPQIFNNAMSASMLVDIVKCVATFFRSATRVLKKKKLKINVHRPVGTRVVFDEEGNTQAPLAMLADKTSGDILLDQDKKNDFYKKMREELKQVDKEDKLLERQRLREKRIKKKMKLKKGQREEEDGDEEEDDLSGSEGEPDANRKRKRSKIYFHSDSDDGEKEEDKAGSAGINAESISLAEQEELALKLLNSMHS